MNIGLQSDGPIVSASTALAFAFGIAIGFGVWAAAPSVIGHRAPWEGSWPYYSTALIAASVLWDWCFQGGTRRCLLGRP